MSTTVPSVLALINRPTPRLALLAVARNGRDLAVVQYSDPRARPNHLAAVDQILHGWNLDDRVQWPVESWQHCRGLQQEPPYSSTCLGLPTPRNGTCPDILCIQGLWLCIFDRRVLYGRIYGTFHGMLYKPGLMIVRAASSRWMLHKPPRGISLRAESRRTMDGMDF